MPLTLEQLAEEAMQLPSASRAILAERIVESLSVADMDEISLWAAEAIRRRDEIRSNDAQPIPGNQVLAEARSIVGRDIASLETLRRAQQIYGEYYERCFWFMEPHLTITGENLPRIVDGLRRYGDRRAWLIAEELCR